MPIDPFRLIAGVLTRWPLIAICILVFGGLGTFAGKMLTHQTFSLSVALIKRRVPQTVRTSEIGQSFRPADLNDATLLATLLATEPRDLAFKKSSAQIPPSEGSSLVEASQLENTDIFYITYHSPISPEDALQFCGIWSDEICEYTKRLQQAEARSVLTILSKEVNALDERIRELNEQLLNFASSNDFIGGESQAAALLDKLSQVELKLEGFQAGKQSLQEQLAELNRKIRHHSPLKLSLRAAQEELANLRSTYTDQNPLVRKKLETISYLKEQIANLGDESGAEPEDFTGTPLGNQLYLDIIASQTRLIETENQIAALKEQKQSVSTRLAEFPALITQYEALRSRRDTFIQELSLMSNRLKEAEIFASGSPGYWQVFESPDSRKVIASSLIKKPLILGVAGAFIGAVIAVLWTLLRTQRTTRRSVLECCATTGAPLKAVLPAKDPEARDLRDLWISSLASPGPTHGPTLLWTGGLDPAEERSFWRKLAEAASADTGRPLAVRDLTPDDLWDQGPESSTLVWNPQDTSKGLLRASTMPDHQGREIIGESPRNFAVVKGEKSSLAARSQVRACLSPFLGTIVLTTPTKGRLRLWADQLSLRLAKYYSQTAS